MFRLYNFSSTLLLVLGFMLYASTAHADFTVTSPVISPESSALKQVIAGQPYVLEPAPTVSGGTAPYTWSISAGTLPAGLAIDPSTGLISGTTATTGSFPVTMQVTDNAGSTTTKDYPLVVYPSAGGLTYSRTPSGSTVSNPVTIHVKGVFGADVCYSGSTFFTVYVEYNNLTTVASENVQATSGSVVDHTFTFTLPPGDYNRVELGCAGNPTGGYQGGKLLEGASNSLLFTVTSPVIGPTSLALKQAIAGEPYTMDPAPTVSGGSSPYVWSISNGTLPNGFTIDSSTGLISGTTATTGSFPVTLQVTDATGASATRDYPFEVYPSAGGFSYNRTPSGSIVTNPVTIHVRGVFGSDICYSGSTFFSVWVEYNNLRTEQGENVQATSGSIADHTFLFNLPPGNYNRVELVCAGNPAGGYQGGKLLESTSISAISNNPPILSAIGNKTVNEGQALSFTVSATDPNGDALTYAATNLPTGATFNPTTHVFSWTPSYGQAGNYNNVEFTVSDNGTPMMLALEDITITVGHVNRAPVFAPVGPQQVLEHSPLSFTVSATDPDSDPVILSVTGLPSGATFNASTGVFNWTPGHPQAGNYVVTFKATDTHSASSINDVVITVGTNPTPTEQAQTLIDTVVATNLPTNITNSYLANLNKVGIFIEQGKVQAAINQLNAFIQKVNTDYSQGKITLAQKNQLVSLAQTLISAL